jgi:hypothetical protein
MYIVSDQRLNRITSDKKPIASEANFVLLFFDTLDITSCRVAKPYSYGDFFFDLLREVPKDFKDLRTKSA